MDGRYVFFIEFVLFATLALGFGVYQLWSVKRDARRAADEKRHAEAQKPQQQDAGS